MFNFKLPHRSIWLLPLCLVTVVEAAALEPASRMPMAVLEQCALSDHDLSINQSLSFWDFDQSDTVSSNARSLSERGCFAEAARATEHYLIHGPILTPSQRDAATWHLGQFLAVIGEETTAARLLATTRHPSKPSEELDWNNYVVGTWAFLVKDASLLALSISKLRVSHSQNANNLAALERLSKCFDKSYKEAYLGKACKSE